MSQTARRLKLSPQDYLAGEPFSEFRHEYIDGVVYAMSGASEQHNLIAGNLFALLRAHLRGGPCRVFMSDMKTRVKQAHAEWYYYPDLQVTCAEQDNARFFKEQPILVVEVLSASTERADRVEKFHAYRHLDSLQEYVLIAQDTRRVEVYRRTTGWELELFQDADVFRLDSMGLGVTLDQVYEDVAFEPVPARGAL